MGVYSHLKEFYPYFDFLGVPQLGDFREFVKHYCKASVVATYIGQDPKIL